MKAWHVLLFLIIIILISILLIIYFCVPIDNFTQAGKIINYEKQKIIENVKLPIFIDHKSMYELYHIGIPDVYDRNNNKIKGVNPNPDKVFHHLEILLNSDKHTVKDEIFEANLYHQGMHNLEPDLEKAEELYKKLYTKLYNKFSNKFNNIEVEPTQDELDVMADCVDGINQLEKIKAYEWLNLSQDGTPIQNTREYEHDFVVEIRDLIDREVVNDMRNYNFDDNFDGIINHEEAVTNDPQNVHNSAVLSTVKNSLKKISKNNHLVNKFESVDEIRKVIEKMKNSDKKKDAIKSLNVIAMQNSKIYSLDMDELEILSTVWNRIKDNHKENDDVVNTLVYQLADMQEHGNTVCSTGRATRLVDTLNIVDTEVKIMPTYAINQEMMLTASNIREKMYQEQTSEERKLLENGTSLNQEDFDNKLKDNITKKLRKDYVNTGVLSEEKFNVELSKWINEI